MSLNAGPGLSDRAIYAAALDLAEPALRQAYLDEVCRDDAERRVQIEQLLAAHSIEQTNLLDKVIQQLGQAEALASERSGGKRSNWSLPPLIERYKIREQIGEGGMGVVYVAEQTNPVRRKVALKIIKPGMDSKDVVARFEAERQALALMDHQNIARVLDAATMDDGRPYFVMELVMGVPITEFCDDNELTNRERLQLFIDVCSAVQHAHQKGIIHRDLKPSNIMVTMNDDRPMPKVIDFGIAKALSQPLTEHSIYTAYGQMVGTPVYMSPEQAQLNATDVDTRSDVYSLGVLLYELLTGSTPFDKETLQKSGFDEMQRLIREVDPPRPSQRISTLKADLSSTISLRRKVDHRALQRSLTGELDWIVMTALEKGRDRRYESASAFARDIQRYLDDEPVLACPPKMMYRLRKLTRRNKRIVTTILAVCVAIVIGTAFSVWQAMEATEARKLADKRLASERVARAESDIHKDQAAENLKEALDAVDQMLMRVADERLASIPGTEAVRQELFQQALKFYEGFFRKAPDDSKLSLSMAIAWTRVGTLHQALSNRSMAQTAREEAIRRFELLHAATPEDSEIQSRLADVCKEFGECEHWMLYKFSTAEPVLKKSIAHWQDLQQRFPNVPEYAWHESHVAITLADNYRVTGRIELARETLNEIVAVQAQLMNPEQDPENHRLHLNYLCQAQLNKGHFLCKYGGDAAEIEAAFAAAVRCADEGMQLGPGLTRWYVHSAHSYGEYLEELGRNPEAEQFYQRAEEAGLRLVREQLGNFDQFHRYPAVLVSLAALRERDGRISAAMSNYLAAVDLMRPSALVPERFGQWDGVLATAELGVLRCLGQMVVSGKRDEALRLCEEFSEPHESLAMTLLSRMLAVRAWGVVGDPSRGRRLLEESIYLVDAQTAMSADERELVGKAFFTWGDREFHRQGYDLAMPLFDLALKFRPTDSESLDHRGQIHLARGQYEKALADFNKSIDCGAVYGSGTLRARARAHFRLGHYASAMADLVEASSRAPHDLKNLTSIPLEEIAACPDDEFRTRFLQFVDEMIEPRNDLPEALVTRATIWNAFGREPEALADLTDAVKAETAPYASRHQAALLSLRLDAVSLYRECCEQMLTNFTNSRVAEESHFTAWTCALAPEAIADYTPAIQLARHAVAKEPHNQQYRTGLGAILMRSGQYDEARTELENALAEHGSGDTSTSYVRYFLAMIEHKLGNQQVAKVQLETAKNASEEELFGSPDWNRKLTLNLLRHESEALIVNLAESLGNEANSPNTRPAPPPKMNLSP